MDWRKKLVVLIILGIIGLSSQFFAQPLRSQNEKVPDPIFAAIVKQIKEGFPGDAARSSDKLAKTHADSAPIQAVHGLALLDCGEFERAKAQFDRALSLDNDNPEAHLGQGELAYGWFHLEEALPHLSKALPTSYFKERAHWWLSRCLHAMNKHAEAKDALESGLDGIEGISDRDTERFKNSIAYFGALGDLDLYKIPDEFESTVVDLSNWNGHILVPLKLNAQDIGKVHLDTGSTGSLAIGSDLAERLNLKVIGERKSRNIEEEFTTKIALLENLQIGDLIVLNVPVSILEGPGEFIGESTGNLGLEVLKRLNMSIDYIHSRLHLFHREKEDFQSTIITADHLSEEIPFWCKKHCLVGSRFNGEEKAPFILDTGAGISLVHSVYFLEKIMPESKAKITKDKAVPFMIKNIEIGGLTFNNIMAAVFDLTDLYAYGNMYYPGIIGANVFQKTILHFNFKDSKLLIAEE
ncbi:MAG: aspartyl protease family protein [Candidatus Aminicenantes bacterium]|nr:MAG: aspartyl protease family protein [Candidatus Aminicenantes bacterium]